ncbi:hypothetical protein PLICRDRAFT_31416 [Plicaturopsis crispa FD-325 SS-3]|nr:hypothetical protein PLICRDRAFT_31416 [Plicaturopsis crispa FD-325 SS-3]
MSSLDGALVPAAQSNGGLHTSTGTELPGDVVPRETSDVEMHEPLEELSGEKSHQPVEEQDEEMDDLFGNDEDVDDAKLEGAQSGASVTGSERLTTPEAEHRKALEYAEEEGDPEGVIEHQVQADVSFPNIPRPHSSNGDHWVIRMPNYVTVDSKPYHPDTYMGPEQDDDESIQAETLREKSNVIKLKVENTVRWRWVKDKSGRDQKQSNSRVIRWSDGSLSLRLGKELFDINQSIDTSGGIARQSFGGSQSSQSQVLSSQPPPTPATPGNKSQGLTYLVAQHKRAQVLQSEALVTGFMSLRPTGMQSETHRMLVRAVGQKHNKVARLRMAPDPTVDPEREVQELMKKSAKKSKKKTDEDGFSRKRRSGLSRRRSAYAFSDDEEDMGFEPSDDDDMEGPGSRRKVQRKASEDGKKGGDYQEDDFVVADESDEDAGDEGSDSTRKRKRRGGGEEEEDTLEKLESQIKEREEEERKRRRRDSGGGGKEGSGADADEQDGEQMDIESEEGSDEEEFKVRRAGAGSTRKKRVVDFEEEDDE